MMTTTFATIFVLALCVLTAKAQIFKTPITAPWPPRSGAGCGLASGLIVAGGVDHNNKNIDDVWTSQDSGETWSLSKNTITLNFPISVTFKNVFYTFSSQTIYTTVDGINWKSTLISTFPYSNIHFASAVVVETSFLISDPTVFLLGGYDGYNAINEICSTKDFVNWVTTTAPWYSRFGMATSAVEENTRMVVVGGSDGYTFHNDAWISSFGGLSWTQINPVGNVLRYGSTLLNIKGYLYLFGGQGRLSSSGPVFQLQDVWSSSDGGSSFNLISQNETSLIGQWGCTFVINRKVILAGGEAISFLTKYSNVTIGFFP